MTVAALLLFASLLASSSATAEPRKARVSVKRLETEATTKLLGTDVRSPRLSWQLGARRRGVRQSAFEVLVASSRRQLRTGDGDVWSTGRVKTSRPWVDYRGPELASRTRYFWSVRVWDQRGKPTPWARPTWLETGFMDPDEWGAEWIGRPATGEPPEDCGGQASSCPLPSPILRTEFKVRRGVKSARLYASGLGLGVYHLNGRRVGDLEMSPAVTHYDHRVFYNTFDVSNLVHRGRNAIGAELGRGWYSMNGRDETWRDEPKLRLELHVTYADGTTQIIESDPSWKATTGPRIYDDLYKGETYDGARASSLAAWTRPGYDDRAWEDAARAQAPAGVLTAQNVEPERITARRRFESVTEVQPGVYVFDLGQNLSGRTEIRVRGQMGDEVTLVHAEFLEEDGTVVAPAGSPFPGGVGEDTLFGRSPTQTDVFRLAGTGEIETYRPQFLYHGFEYVQITGWPGDTPPTLDDVTAEVINTDFKRAGRFSASEGLLTRIVRNTRWAVRQNGHGLPTASSTFHKEGVTGDGQIMVPSWIWLFDTQLLHAKWTADIEDSQAADGEVPEYFPAQTPTLASHYGLPLTGGHPLLTGPSPGFDVALFSVARDLHRYFGDSRPLVARYDAMKRYLDYASRFAPNDFFRTPGAFDPGVGVGPGGIGDLNQPRKQGAGGPNGAWPDSNAWLYEMERIAAETARLLGREDQAALYDEKAASTKAQFNAVFLDREAGLYRDPADNGGHNLGEGPHHTPGTYSQHVNAIALELGLVPPDLRQVVADNLAADVVARDYHLSTGAIGTRFLWPALSHNGHLLEAVRTAAQTTYPSYGYWIDVLGWTAMAEAWEEDSRSLNSHFQASIVQWLFEDLAGMEPLKPGFKKIEIRPEVPAEDLRWVKASHDSVRGRIGSSWRIAKRRLCLRAMVPPNSTARIHFPGAKVSQVRERGRRASSVPGVRKARNEDGSAVFATGSGTYHFCAPWRPGANRQG